MTDVDDDDVDDLEEERLVRLLRPGKDFSAAVKAAEKLIKPTRDRSSVCREGILAWFELNTAMKALKNEEEGSSPKAAKELARKLSAHLKSVASIRKDVNLLPHEFELLPWDEISKWQKRADEISLKPAVKATQKGTVRKGAAAKVEAVKGALILLDHFSSKYPRTNPTGPIDLADATAFKALFDLAGLLYRATYKDEDPKLLHLCKKVRSLSR
jgi:hypothetical protein